MPTRQASEGGLGKHWTPGPCMLIESRKKLAGPQDDLLELPPPPEDVAAAAKGLSTMVVPATLSRSTTLTRSEMRNSVKSLGGSDLFHGTPSLTACAENLTDLKLDDIRLAGEDLLHDPTSGYLYEDAPGRPQPDENPKVVGIMVQGTLRRRERPWSFFSILYKHCLSHKDAMKNMLEKYANERTGRLHREHLGMLVCNLLPNTSMDDQIYLEALMDVEGESTLESYLYETLMAKFKQLSETEDLLKRTRAWAQPKTKKALQRIGTFFRDNQNMFVNVFRRFDDNMKGHLTLAEVRQLLQHFEEVRLDSGELTLVLCHIRSCDVYGHGWITLRDLVLAFGGRILRRPRRQASNAAAREQRNIKEALFDMEFAWREWSLDIAYFDSQSYMVDRQTMRVFYNTDSEMDTPMLAGVVEDGELLKMDAEWAFYHTITAYLNRRPQNRIKFGECFNKVNINNTGFLDERTAGMLLTEMFGHQVAVTNAQYFTAMLDLERNGRITFNELLEAMKNCRAAESIAMTTTSPDLKTLLERTAKTFRSHHTLLRKNFKEFDRNRNGLIDVHEFRWIVRRLMPHQSTNDRRILIAFVTSNDVDQNIQGMTLRLLLQIIGAVKPVTEGTKNWDAMPSRGGESPQPALMLRRPKPNDLDDDEHERKPSRGSDSESEPDIDDKAAEVERRLTLSHPGSKNAAGLVSNLSLRMTQEEPGGETKKKKTKDKLSYFATFSKLMSDPKIVDQIRHEFKAYDDFGKGIEPDKFKAVCAAVLPPESPADSVFLDAMVELDVKGYLPFDRMMEHILTCKLAEDDARAKSTSDKHDAMMMHILLFLNSQLMPIEKLFEQFDTDHMGYLTLMQLRQLYLHCKPDLSVKDMCCLLARARAYDKSETEETEAPMGHTNLEQFKDGVDTAAALKWMEDNKSVGSGRSGSRVGSQRAKSVAGKSMSKSMSKSKTDREEKKPTQKKGGVTPGKTAEPTFGGLAAKLKLAAKKKKKGAGGSPPPSPKKKVKKKHSKSPQRKQPSATQPSPGSHAKDHKVTTDINRVIRRHIYTEAETEKWRLMNLMRSPEGSVNYCDPNEMPPPLPEASAETAADQAEVLAKELASLDKAGEPVSHRSKQSSHGGNSRRSGRRSDSPSNGAFEAQLSATKHPWTLERLQTPGGKNYLIDRISNRLFNDKSGEDASQHPELVGQYVNGKVELHRGWQYFTRLCDAIDDRPHRISMAFQELPRDETRCKALAKDVPNALHFVLPIQSQVEMEYVSAMFTLKQPGESSDANDSTEVTLEQIIKHTRECAEAEKEPYKQDSLVLLQKVAEYVTEHHHYTQDMFNELDTTNRSQLNMVRWRRMMGIVLHWAKNEDFCRILVHVYMHSLSFNGYVSMREFAQAIGAVQVLLPAALPPEDGNKSRMKVRRHSLSGKSLLEDGVQHAFERLSAFESMSAIADETTNDLSRPSVDTEALSQGFEKMPRQPRNQRSPRMSLRTTLMTKGVQMHSADSSATVPPPGRSDAEGVASNPSTARDAQPALLNQPISGRRSVTDLKPSPSVPEWIVEPLMVCSGKHQRMYHVDRTSGLIYDGGDSMEELILPVGILKRGTMQPLQAGWGLFGLISELSMARPDCLVTIWQRYAALETETVDSGDLTLVTAEALGYLNYELSQGELFYIQAMMEVSTQPYQAVGFSLFSNILEKCKRSEEEVSSGGGNTRKLIVELRSYIREKQVDVTEMFLEHLELGGNEISLPVAVSILKERIPVLKGDAGLFVACLRVGDHTLQSVISLKRFYQITGVSRAQLLESLSRAESAVSRAGSAHGTPAQASPSKRPASIVEDLAVDEKPTPDLTPVGKEPPQVLSKDNLACGHPARTQNISSSCSLTSRAEDQPEASVPKPISQSLGGLTAIKQAEGEKSESSPNKAAVPSDKHMGLHMFHVLDRFCAPGAKQLGKLFNKFSMDGYGKLGSMEIVAIANHLIKRCSVADLRLLQALLEQDYNATLSSGAFRQLCSDVNFLAEQLKEPELKDAAKLLCKMVANVVVQDTPTFNDAFESVAGKRTLVDTYDVMKIFELFIPTLQDEKMRLFLCVMHEALREFDGQVSKEQLIHMFTKSVPKGRTPARHNSLQIWTSGDLITEFAALGQVNTLDGQSEGIMDLFSKWRAVEVRQMDAVKDLDEFKLWEAQAVKKAQSQALTQARKMCELLEADLLMITGAYKKRLLQWVQDDPSNISYTPRLLQVSLQPSTVTKDDEGPPSPRPLSINRQSSQLQRNAR